MPAAPPPAPRGGDTRRDARGTVSLFFFLFSSFRVALVPARRLALHSPASHTIVLWPSLSASRALLPYHCVSEALLLLPAVLARSAPHSIRQRSPAVLYQLFLRV